MYVASNSSPRQGDPRRAAAAVEMAYVLPVLTFLLLATIDFGRLFYSYVTVTNCARNGALWASSSPNSQKQSPYYSSSNTTAQNLTAAAQADASNLSPLPTVAAPLYSTTYNNGGTNPWSLTSPPGTAGVTDGYVQVTVSWTFTTIVTYPGIPHTMNLSRTATMRLIPN